MAAVASAVSPTVTSQLSLLLPPPLLQRVLQLLPLCDKLTAISRVTRSLRSAVLPSSFVHDQLLLTDTTLTQLRPPLTPLARAAVQGVRIVIVKLDSLHRPIPRGVSLDLGTRRSSDALLSFFSATFPTTSTASTNSFLSPFASLNLLSVDVPISSLIACCVLSTLFSSSFKFPHLHHLRVSGGSGNQALFPSTELAGLATLPALVSLRLELKLDAQSVTAILALPLLRDIDLSKSVLETEAESLDEVSSNWNVPSHCRTLRLPRVIGERAETAVATCFVRMLQRYRTAAPQRITAHSQTNEQRRGAAAAAAPTRFGCTLLQELDLCDLVTVATLVEAASISSLTQLNVARLPDHSALLSLLSTLCITRLPHLSAVCLPVEHDDPVSEGGEHGLPRGYLDFFQLYSPQLRVVELHQRWAIEGAPSWAEPVSALVCGQLFAAALACTQLRRLTFIMLREQQSELPWSALFSPLHYLHTLSLKNLCLGATAVKELLCALPALQDCSLELLPSPSVTAALLPTIGQQCRLLKRLVLCSAAQTFWADEAFATIQAAMGHVPSASTVFHLDPFSSTPSAPPPSDAVLPFLHLRILRVRSPSSSLPTAPPTPSDSLLRLFRLLRFSPLLLLDADVQCDDVAQLLELRTALPHLRALRLSRVRRLRSLMRPFCYHREAFASTDAEEWTAEIQEREWTTHTVDEDDDAEAQYTRADSEARMMATEEAERWIDQCRFAGKDGKEAFCDRIAQIAA